jgi:CHAD domain-containing protein
MRYGIEHVLAVYFKEDGSTDYGILKSIDGKSLSFKSAMKVEDNTLVFVDEKTYFHWLRVELPQSPYSLEAFQSKIFHSINLLQEDKFKLYPVVAFVKNLTQRIAGDLLKEMEELKEQLGKD